MKKETKLQSTIDEIQSQNVCKNELKHVLNQMRIGEMKRDSKRQQQRFIDRSHENFLNKIGRLKCILKVDGSIST